MRDLARLVLHVTLVAIIEEGCEGVFDNMRMHTMFTRVYFAYISLTMML